MTDDPDQALGRAHRRLLRRICNGRTVPLLLDGQAFLTYREASRYVLSLPPEARDAAVLALKRSAGEGSRT